MPNLPVSAADDRAAAKNGGAALFLSYNSRDRQAVRQVQQLLQARSISTFLDRDNLTPGLPWADELEAALNRVRAVAIFIGQGDLGPWQKREMGRALERQAQAEKCQQRFPVIPVVLPGADLSKAPGFLLLNTCIDLSHRLDDAPALEAMVRAVHDEASVPQTPSTIDLCPYRALQAFREEDAPLFCGREELAQELLDKVRKHALVAVIGPSGSGKSSVVQAGLLPLLRRERNHSWDILIFTPGQSPWHNLAAAFISNWMPDADPVKRFNQAEETSETMQKEGALGRAIAQTLKQSGGTDRLLVVVDQFEELFTLTAEQSRRSFIEALLATTAVFPVTLVLTLRADFYSQAISLNRDLTNRIQHGLINVGPMTRQELQRAIENPARSVGLDFEPGLVERLLDHVEEQPGHLPLLEFALTELWGRKRGRMLRHQQYNAIGEVEGAISKRAEEQFAKLSADQQAIALRVLTRLVRVATAGEEGTDTRQRVKLSELDEAARKVVQSFTDARLLVTSRNELAQGEDELAQEEIVEVAHEALIRRWERLRELLNNDRDFLLWRQRLGFQLSEWQRTGGDEGALLRGAALLEARRWTEERRADLNQQELDFVLLTESAEYQIQLILTKAPELVPLADPEVLKEWVVALSLAGRNAAALAAVETVPEAEEQSRLCVAAAEALSKAGQKQSARAFVEKARSAVDSITEQYSRSQAWAGIVQALLSLEQTEAALAVARKIEDARGKARAFLAVTQALLSAGQMAMASKTAAMVFAATQAIWDRDEEASIRRTTAEAVFSARQAEAVMAAVGKMRSAESQAQAYLAFTEVLTAAGQMAAARQAVAKAFTAASRVRYSEDQEEILATIVNTLLRAEHLDVACAAAEVTKPAAAQVSAYCTIAGAMLASGQTDSARKVALKALGAAKRILQALHATKRFDVQVRNFERLRIVVEVLSKSGLIHEALAAVEKIKEAEYQQVDMYLTITQVLLASHHTAMVLELAALVFAAAGKISGNGSKQSRIFATVSVILGRAQQTEALLTLAGEIDNFQVRAFAYRSITATLLKLGQIEMARKAAIEAFRAARWMWNRDAQMAVIEAVSQAMVDAGQAAAALAVAEEIEDINIRGLAGASILECLMRFGQLENWQDIPLDVFRTARGMGEWDSQNMACAIIAEALLSLGQIAAAKTSARVAFTAASDVTEPDAQAQAYVRATQALLRTQQTVEARQAAQQAMLAAEKIELPEKQVQTWTAVIEGLYQSGQATEAKSAVAKALDALGRIADYDRPRICATAVQTLLRCGQPEEAKRFTELALVPVRERDDAEARTRAYRSIALAMAESAWGDAAVTIAGWIKASNAPWYELREIAAALSKSGNLAQAQKVIEGLTDPWHLSEARAAVAAELLKRRQYAEAFAMAEEILHPSTQAKTCVAVTKVLLREGQRELAMKAAEKALTVIGKERYGLGAQEKQIIAAAAEALAELGRAETALAIAKEFDLFAAQAHAYTAITEGLIKAGRWDEAGTAVGKIFAAAGRIWSQHVQEVWTEMLCKVVAALIGVGLTEALLVAIREIENEETQALAYATITAALLQAGRIEAAVQLVNEPKTAFSRYRILVTLAETMLSCGRTRAGAQYARQAFAAIEKIDQAEVRTQAYVAVTALLSRASQPQPAQKAAQQALLWAGKISNAAQQAQAYVAVTETLLSLGLTDKARTAVEHTFAAASSITRDEQARSKAFAGVARMQARLRAFTAARESAERCSSSRDKLSAWAAILLEYTKAQTSVRTHGELC